MTRIWHFLDVNLPVVFFSFSKLSPACQILLFSATYDEQVMEFARDYVPNPIEIRVKRTQLPLKNIKQYYLLFNDWMEKYQALTDIYGGFTVGQAIIFCDVSFLSSLFRDAA